MTGDVADTAHARNRLHSLTSLRFLAAALVLLHHVTYLLTPGSFAAGAMSVGYVGVGFFFALSGFVLTWSFSPHLATRHFYGRRFARIYPLHLATAAVATLLLVVAGDYIDPWPSLLNLALLQSWVPLERYGSSLNGVSWSLCCEAFFYAVFPLLIRVARRFRGPRDLMWATIGTGAAMLVSAAVVIAVMPAEVAQQILYKGPAFRVGGFVLGIIAAVAVQRGFRSPLTINHALALAAGSYVLAYLVAAALPRWGLIPFRVYGDLVTLPAALALIVTAATSDLAGRQSWLRDRRLIALGEASFALYMVHFLLIAGWLRWVHRPTSLAAGLVEAAFLCVAAVAVSLATYRFLERPAEASLRRRLGQRRQTETSRQQ